MRKVFFGAALAFALAGTAASAGVVEEHSHSTTHLGGGGWTGGYGVGGWKGNYGAKTATGEISSVTFSSTKAPSTIHLDLERRDFARRELAESRRDPDCIFVFRQISSARWRPGCKNGTPPVR